MQDLPSPRTPEWSTIFEPRLDPKGICCYAHPSGLGVLVSHETAPGASDHLHLSASLHTRKGHRLRPSHLEMKKIRSDFELGDEWFEDDALAEREAAGMRIDRSVRHLWREVSS